MVMQILILHFEIVLIYKSVNHIDTDENLDIIMPTYNLIKYSDNYSVLEVYSS